MHRSLNTSWYRFGDGYLALRSADQEFADRFRDLHADCGCSAPENDAPSVGCTIEPSSDGSRIMIHYEDVEPLDPLPFALSILGPHGYTEKTPDRSSVRVLSEADSGAALTFDRAAIIADAASRWHTLAASLAVHRVIRLQRDLSVFHAGSIAVSGRGALLMGAKGAGKTTLSLAFAERGHDLFGDELAALRRKSLTIVPFRRRLCIRNGPACRTVEAARASGKFRTALIEDGAERTFARVSELFPGPQPAPERLHAIFFLRGRSDAPAATRFQPGMGDARLLAPFESMTWGGATGRIAFELLQLLGRVPCYHLDLGPIADTVELVETLLMENSIESARPLAAHT